MTPVLYRAQADLRSRWRAWVGLAVIVGLFGGAVTAAAAGARRTDGSYKRFLVATKAAEILVFAPPGDDPTFANVAPADIVRLPQVVQSGRGASFGVTYPADVNLFAPADGRIGRVFQRKKILAGRDVRADRADEVTISFTLAKAHHLGVGDRLRLQFQSSGPNGEPVLEAFTFKIVGIDAAPGEFPPQQGTGINLAWGTPAFYRAHVSEVLSYDSTGLRLRHGARDVPAVLAAIQRLAGGKPVQSFPLADQAVNTQRSIHLQAVALWMLAGLLALAAVLVLIQLLVRQSLLESAEYPDLRALGMSPSQLWAVGLARGVLLGMAGAVLAVVVAFVLSPLLPVGLARTAEPRPGLAADALALGLGALATAVLTAATAAWPSWRAARLAARQQWAVVPAGRAHPSAVAGALSRTAAPASVTTGVRLALEPGRGRTAVPVRSTIAGAVVGVAALATALGFSASLSHLLGTPRLYGVTWDALATSVAGDDISPIVPLARADPRVAALSVGHAGFPLTIGRTRVDGMAVEPSKGASLTPTPVQGRVPERAGEIMLGSRSMTALHVRIGDTVRVSLAGTPPVVYRVVGKGVFPSLSDALGLGRGAAITESALERSLPPGVPVPPPDHALIRFRPGVDKAKTIAALGRRVSRLGDTVAAPDKPIDLVNFGRVQNLPLVLAALLGGLAAATLAHLLVTSIRRRRRDLAILKTLGFASRQVRTTVAWQATTLAVLAVLLGVPVGVAAGRWVWILFAHQLGIVPEPTVPLVTLFILAAAAVAVANLVAVVPARVAARLHPAPVLRSE